MMDKVKTGIENLDKILKGGIPRGWVVLVSGGPGTGKSILATQFLYEGIEKYHENGVYVTFDESITNIKKTMIPFGWDLKKYEKEGKLGFLDLSYTKGMELEERGHFDLGVLVELIKKTIMDKAAKRVVIDPVTMLSYFYEEKFEVRKCLLALIRTLNELGCTTMMTHEIRRAELGHDEMDTEEFASQGLIRLYYHRDEMNRFRAIEVLKMRGSRIIEKVFPFEIRDNGIYIHLTAEVFI